MVDSPKTCVDPYLDSFTQSFAAANYKAGTIKNYLNLVRKLGRLMDATGIEPSALTPDLADQLARTAARGPASKIRLHNLARQFTEHLINIGVAQPVPVSAAQVARTALLADLAAYLIKQRGLSPRSIGHVQGFANRFLDHRFGTAMFDLAGIRAADVIGFVQHLLASRHPYRDKTVATHLRTFFQYLFWRGATATNLAPCIPKTANRWNARLPRHLSPDGVESVLASVRSNPRHGARDYAMLLLMARLGLRAAEVIAIQLDDIDWRTAS